MKRIIMLAVLTLVVSTTASAQVVPQVSSVTPVHNDMDVSVSANVSITFNTDMNVASLSDSTIIVTGSLSGYHTGTVSYWWMGKVATFNPDIDFTEGEVVYVIVATGVQSLFGHNMSSSYAFNFRIGPTGGSGHFGNYHGISVDDIDEIGRPVPADIDGDGYLDIAVVRYRFNDVVMYHNNGDGTFSRCWYGHPLDPNPSRMCAGDLDMDGDVDFVVSSSASELVTILINTGDCNFSRYTRSINSGDSQPGALILAALGDNGHLDIITANFDNTISVIHNLGNGSFSSTTTDYPVSGQPNSITAEDFDNDGDIDVAMGCNPPSGIRVLMNNGDGTFGACIEYPSFDMYTKDIVSADFNGDGYVDLATCDPHYTDRVSISLNNGDGTFAPYESFLTLHDAWSIFPADVDADGDMDILVNGHGATVWFNDGNAGFVVSEQYYGGLLYTDFITAGDMDNDGDMDMVIKRSWTGYTATDIIILDNLNNPRVVSHSPGQNELDVSLDTKIYITFDKDMDGSTFNSWSIVVDGRSSGRHWGGDYYNNETNTVRFTLAHDFLAGEVVTVTLTSDIQCEDEVPLHGYSWSFVAEATEGSGAFVVDSTYATGDMPTSVCVASLNWGAPDIITTNFMDDNISVMFSNGDGTLASQSTYAAGNGPVQICTGDFDRDSHVDISVSNKHSDDVSVFINNGNGTFAVQAVYPVGDTPYSIHAADLNADGYLDLVTANYESDNVSVLLNNGDGTFASDTVYSVGDGPHSVCAADLDGDGCLDLATANEHANTMSRLLNNGDGTFDSRLNYIAGSDPYSICAVDVDGDGDCDLAVSNRESDAVSVLLNDGAGGFLARTEYAVGDWPSGVDFGDLDGDGDIDIISANYSSDDVSILLNAGSGAFLPGTEYSTGDRPCDAYPADLDWDGDLDLVVVNIGSDVVTILLNQNPIEVTLPISVTGTDIPFVDGPDTIAILNFALETLDSLTIIACPGQVPPNIPDGTDWVRRYYEITSYPPGATFEADMELFYAQQEFDDSGLPDESLLHMYRYDDGAAEWEVQLGILDMAANCISCTGVTEFSIWAFTESSSLVGDEPGQAPAATALYQNYPNPFNPATQIKYVLHRDSDVNLAVYDVLGRKVATLVDGKQTTGYKTVTWNGRDGSGNQMASGVYFYRLVADDFVQTRKMVLLR